MRPTPSSVSIFLRSDRLTTSLDSSGIACRENCLPSNRPAALSQTFFDAIDWLSWSFHFVYSITEAWFTGRMTRLILWSMSQKSFAFFFVNKREPPSSRKHSATQLLQSANIAQILQKVFVFLQSSSIEQKRKRDSLWPWFVRRFEPVKHSLESNQEMSRVFFLLRMSCVKTLKNHRCVKSITMSSAFQFLFGFPWCERCSPCQLVLYRNVKSTTTVF